MDDTFYPAAVTAVARVAEVVDKMRTERKRSRKNRRPPGASPAGDGTESLPASGGGVAQLLISGQVSWTTKEGMAVLAGAIVVLAMVGAVIIIRQRRGSWKASLPVTLAVMPSHDGAVAMSAASYRHAASLGDSRSARAQATVDL
ncbi:MAG: hypothetical protein J2P27_05135 [Actinobacteria bacterium]|nr:hypothetical protein [Actinomycetota bacterium]